MAVEVVNNETDERFEIRVDGELAGLAEYQSRRGIIAFMHTETTPAFKGQGFGRQLVAEALDGARAEGLWVLPFCPFVCAYIVEHPEYIGLVPRDLHANFGYSAD